MKRRRCPGPISGFGLEPCILTRFSAFLRHFRPQKTLLEVWKRFWVGLRTSGIIKIVKKVQISLEKVIFQATFRPKKIISKNFQQNLTFFKDFDVCFCFANLEHIFSKLSEYIFKRLGCSDCQKTKKMWKKVLFFWKKWEKNYFSLVKLANACLNNFLKLFWKWKTFYIESKALKNIFFWKIFQKKLFLVKKWHKIWLFQRKSDLVSLFLLLMRFVNRRNNVFIVLDGPFEV